MHINHKLAIISTLFLLIPLMLSFFAYKKAGVALRLFTFFLLFGFFVDSSGMYNYLLRYWELPYKRIPVAMLHYMQEVYPLLESVFYFWFLHRIMESKLKKIYGIAFLITAWAVMKLTLNENSGYFDALYEVILTFMSSWAILKMIERYPDALQREEFWLTMGIFFYCLSTFFYFVMEKSHLATILYPIHFFVNIFTYVFFMLGFILQIRVKPKSRMLQYS